MDVVAIIYICMNICLVIFNTHCQKKLLNSLNIYLLIWSLMVFAYHLKLISFYDLSAKTWFVLFLATLLVYCGYYFGRRVKVGIYSIERNYSKDELIRIIKICSFISMIAIIPNTIFLIQRYGINLLENTTQIYYDNINGVAPTNIPYLSVFAQTACVFSGMLVAEYGFHKVIALPLFLAILSILPSGSRGGLILTIFYLVLPVIMLYEKEKFKKNIKLKVLIPGVVAVIAVFILLTINRSAQLDPTIYSMMSSKMNSVALVAPAVFKLYQYFASPIGVLNAFLNEPEFYFGINTFSSFYHILNRIGIDVEYVRYQKFYDIPIRTNVGTWLRELTNDFSLIGMLIVVFVFCAFVGYFEKKSQLSHRYTDVYITTVLDTVFVMSFFVWYFREGSMVVMILAYFIVSSKLSKIRIKTTHG